MAVEDPYDKLKNLPPGLVARLKADRDKSKAEIDLKNEEFARKFKFRDSVQGIGRTPSGLMDPSSDIVCIRKFQNDYGDTVYVKSVNSVKSIDHEAIPPEDQIRALSGRIKVQQAGFQSLDSSEQSRIRTDFTSSGTDARFGVYLTNEALAQQFQKLK